MDCCCIVIPAYEPDEMLVQYLQELTLAHPGPIVVVDDGSGPSYKEIFQEVKQKKGCYLLSHEDNKGKGAAIKTAIRWYKENLTLCRGIVTADCDGQHTVKSVLAVEKGVLENPDALILGCRGFGPETPERSMLGNRVSSGALAALYGIRLKDTQTGLRGMPNQLLDKLEALEGDRYEYELNMLISLKRECVRFVMVPIDTVYFNNNAGSHYRTIRDSLPIIRQLSKGLVQYGVSSLLSAVTDMALYTLLVKWILAAFPFTQRLFLSAVIARALSSIVNYSFNRRLPYVQDKRVLATAGRYYILWFFQLAASFSGAWLLCMATGIDELPGKFLVDLFLAAVSYQVQLRWVFRKAEEKQ